MKHPFSVTLTGWMVLILTLWNALRVWTSVAWEEILAEYSVQLAPGVSASVGGFWFIAGLILLVGMRLKKAWIVKLLPWAASGYTVWYWSERFFFQSPHPNIPFAVIVNLILLVIIFFATKSLSREAYERNIENPKVE